MSVQAISWAMETECPSPSAKLVLICLANYSDGDGVCFPGQRRLAENTGLSQRQIIRILKQLEDSDIISRERRNRVDGSRTSDKYQLHFNQSDKMAPCTKSKVTSATSQGDMVSGQYIAKAISEPSEEPSDINACARDDQNSGDQYQFDDFWSSYPRKVGKPAAQKAFTRAIKTNSSQEIMLGLARKSAEWARDGTEVQFIPHPSTFLNQERFNDEPQPPSKPPSKPQSAADRRAEDVRKYKQSIAAKLGTSWDGSYPEEVGSCWS